MTKHKGDCKMSFGRKDPTCPRCQELLAGAPAIQQPWRRKQDTFPTYKHDCRKENCGPICTHGDW